MTRAMIVTALFCGLAMSGCEKRRAAARDQLLMMNMPFSDSGFIDSARQGNLGAIAAFIAAGMSLDVKNSDGMTPLMAAVLARKPEAVELLLENGADVNASSKSGATALIIAAAGGDQDMVSEVLTRRPKMDQQSADGMTALMFAAW